MMARRSVSVTAGLGVWGLLLCAALPAAAALPEGHTRQAPWDVIQGYCVKCHNAEDWAGGVAFDTMTNNGIDQDAKTWEAAVRKLRGGLMPPPGAKQPAKDSVTGLVSFLETSLDAGATTTPYAGRVPLRRLNRREYANAIHDLIGLDIDPAAYGCRRIRSRMASTPTPALLQMTPSLPRPVRRRRKLARAAGRG